VLGVHDTLGAFGGVAAPAVAVAVGGGALAAWGWRALFLAGGIGGAALALLFALRTPRRLPDDFDPRAGAAARASVREYLALFADRRFAAFVAATVLYAFTYNGVAAFLPLFLVRHGGLTEATAGLLYAALFAASVVQALTGDLSDRVGRLPVMGGLLLLSGGALAAMLRLSGPLALGTAVVLFGVGGHGYRPVRSAYLVTVIPDDVAGGTLGVVRTVVVGAGAASPAFVGLVSEAAGFVSAFGALAAATLLSATLVFALELDGE
jgi:predicted MFS family arabinose efflux permease